MLPVTPVAVPLFTAALLAATSKLIASWVSTAIAIASLLCVLAVNVFLMYSSSPQPIVYWFGGWRPRGAQALGISFVIDPLGAGFAAFATLLTLAAFVFSSKYFDSVGNHFHALLLAFLAAMCGFCLTGDMFNLFVFFELMSAAAFALCGYKTDDPSSVQGALNFAVVNTIGAYFVLTGVGLIYARTSALNMAQIGRALAKGPLDTVIMVGFVFLVCGYLVKAAIFPFHFWLADAHAVAPTPVCVLFSGVMVEMGIFALARVYWTSFDPALHTRLPALRNVFVTAGVLTAVIGACMCYLQRNIKRLLAFSTISHVGLMTVGIGLFAPVGLAGAAVYTLGHGMIKGALFMVAGILLHRFRTIDKSELHGKGRTLRWTGALFIIGAFGLAGLPGSGVALGHDVIAEGGRKLGYSWFSTLFIFAEGLTAAAVLRAAGHIFLGWGPHEENSPGKAEEKPETRRGKGTPATMFVPALVLLICGMALGLVHGLQPSTLRAAAVFENSAAYASRVMGGLSVPNSPAPLPSFPAEPVTGLLTVVGAIAVATVHLSSARVREISAKIAVPLKILHQIHSGNVVDYVVFLTIGMAAFGLICSYFVL
jgi:multicomponent Na+:H+ antiporter subunit D